MALFQAKALAEKNMRDLVAQKEQAERNVTIFATIKKLLEIWNDFLFLRIGSDLNLFAEDS